MFDAQLTRSTITPHVSTWNQTITGTWVNGSPVTSSGTMNTGQDVEQKWSGSNPGWRRSLTSGSLLPFTDYAYHKYNSSGTGQETIHLESIDPSGYYHSTRERILSGGAVMPFTVLPGDLYALVDSDKLEYALQKAAADMYADGHDTLTMIAELDKTGKMFFNLFRSFMRKPSEWREWARKSKRDALTTSFNAWMEGRYGWRTLWYDIKELERQVSRLGTLRTRSKRSSNLTSSNTVTVRETYDRGYFLPTIKQELTCDFTYRGSIIADFSPTSFRFNPLLTAWELTRWSFVIDWFVDIGTMLEASMFMLHPQEKAMGTGYQCTFQKTTTCESVARSSVINHVNTSTFTQNTSATGISIRRYPRDSISLKPGVFQSPLDPFKIVDLAAILWKMTANTK